MREKVFLRFLKRVLLFLLMPLTSVLEVNASTHTTVIDGVKYKLYYNSSSPSSTYAEVIDGSNASGDVFIESTYEYNHQYFSVRYIAKDAFRYNDNITSVIIPTSIIEIGEYAFARCSNLKKVDIYYNENAKNLQKIDRGAFEGSGLESIYLPPSVTDLWGIDEGYCDIFIGCDELTAIKVHSDNPVFSSYDGVLYNKSKKKLLLCPDGKTQISIATNCQIIGDHSCSTTNLKSVVLPESVTAIEPYAFAGNFDLQEVYIPESVKTIGEGAFGCGMGIHSGMKNLIIPKSVSKIGARAFTGRLFNTVEYLAENPITGTTDWFEQETYDNAVLYLSPAGMSEAKTIEPWKNFVNVSSKGGIEEGMTFEVDGINYKLISAENNQAAVIEAASGKYSGDIILPSSVTYQGQDFSITVISESAFEACSDLNSVKLPDTLTSIEDFAFEACTSLNSIEFPNGLTEIGWFSFSECSSLEFVRIPVSVKEIGDGPFSECSNLEFISVDSKNTSYSAIEGILYDKDISTLIQCPGKKYGKVAIPSTVSTIGQGAFWGCLNVDEVDIPESVEFIKDNAFYGCKSLASVVIPDHVSKLGQSSFRECTNLNSVTLGSSLTQIGDDISESFGLGAFIGSDNIKTIYCRSSVPLANANLGCSTSVYNYATLYVPKNSFIQYKMTSPWSKFRQIIEYDNAGLDDVYCTQQSEQIQIYNLNGAKIECPFEDLTPGIYIIRSGSNVEKITVN